jgi:thiol-disulfide isomerase/thioredoxin/tetratricopeptide (TPR) repeat protein
VATASKAVAWVVLWAFAILPASGCAPAAVSSATPVNAAQAAPGSAAPAFAATSLDGTAVGLADYTGKVVVLNFWATWCPPCRAETPDIMRSFAALGSKDVAFLGIDTTETAPIVKTFVALHGVPYPVALAGPATYNAYGISYIPTTIVLDATGIVRARWTGAVTPPQLAAYVASARAGKNAEYLTPQQRRIDAMLALTGWNFAGDRSRVEKEIARAKARLAAVAAYTDKLDTASTPRYDFERTRRETGELQLAAAQAALKIAATKEARVAAYRLLGAAYGDRNRYADAAGAYQRALALRPSDAKSIQDITLAYYRLHDYDDMVKSATEWTAAAPSDPDAWNYRGLAEQRRANFTAAAAAYRTSLALALAKTRAHPPGNDGAGYADIADESLDFANVYVALGDASNAARAFDQARRYAALVPDASPQAVMKQTVRDRTAEGMSAVALAHGSGTRVALTPWMGAGLPGSLASKYRYRLVAVAPPGTTVQLGTKGVRAGWIASFCQDRLCSPNSVSFPMPIDGVKTFEFQLVPPSAGAVPGRVWVGDGSNWVATQ